MNAQFSPSLVPPARKAIVPDDFAFVGPGHRKEPVPAALNRQKHGQTRDQRAFPTLSLLVLALIALGCLCSDAFINHDPAEFYLSHLNEAPNAEFWFGTDSLGRDIFSIIWAGGRVSLFIGLTSAAWAACIGVVYGCISGTASSAVDATMMRAVELLQSVPILLTLLLILSLLGRQSPVSIALVIGSTGWFALARIVRGEIRQIRNSEYILVSRHMGAPFLWIMHKHLIPNIISAIMFIVISSVSTNMALESTLSFLGMGLPVDELSWGSMLALADRALLLNTWWVIVIPGFFLVVTLLCITNIGHIFRRQGSKIPSNL